MRSSIWCVLAAAASAESAYDVNHRSNCDADGRRLHAERVLPAAKNMTFLELDGGPQPPPMDDQHIFKGDTCLDDTFVKGYLTNSGGCRFFACDTNRFAYCNDADHHCKCPDGMCAVAEDDSKPTDLTCQIRRTKAECPPGSGINWMMEHIEVQYDEDEQACIFLKTTGIDELWDAVAWTDNPNIRDITWHTIGKNSDRDFGYTADPIADSTEEPITHGVGVAMDILDSIAPPAGLTVQKGGHTTTIRMEIVEARKTHFELDGNAWGYNENNLDVAQDMHAIMWIKQRCGKLKVTDIRLDVPCILGDWSSWGDCHPATEGGRTCGPGVQDRTRQVLQQGTYAGVCHSSLTDRQSCNQGCCPVNCVLADWSEWGDCSEACGGGTQTRTRATTQQPSCGGTECEATTDSQTCNMAVCAPQDCEWSEWGDYSDCSAVCDGGTQTRMRNIVKESRAGGHPCRKEDSSQVDSCNTQACERIDCEWSAWGDWGECSATCNGGVRSKSRQVTQEAHHGGDVCDAASDQSEECNVQACTDTWTAGDGADIATDGVTFTGEAADSVVYSQMDVESISVRNGAVSGSVQIGLAPDSTDNFDSGAGVVLPYNGAQDSDIVTVGIQHGHAKVFLNDDPTPVQDLGEIGDVLMAKVILDAGASVRISGIDSVANPSSIVLSEEAVAETKETVVTGNVPSWTFYAAMAAVSVSMIAAIACRRSQPTAGAQQPLLQQ